MNPSFYFRQIENNGIGQVVGEVEKLKADQQEAMVSEVARYLRLL